MNVSDDGEIGDVQLQCVGCGQVFLWTVGEQRRYQELAAEIGGGPWRAPRRCFACRAIRRAERQAATAPSYAGRWRSDGR